MKNILALSLALGFALVAPATAGDLSAAERAALRGAGSTDLAALRAGESAEVPAVAQAERLALVQAQAAAPELLELRAGEMDDRTLATIGIVIGVIVLAIIIF